MAAELVKATRGNPLAFAEVVERLTDAQRLGAAPLPEPLPLGARLEQLYHPLLAGLSAPAWKAVLLCAANPRGGSAASVAALRLAGVDADAALEEAEERGVLVRDRGVLQFRHPLARTTAWLLATPAQRRAAHRALAAVLPGDAAAAARTWHLSEAATGPDDAVADALVAVAGEERERRGYAAASAALERAAELSTHPERAAERLADAVADAFVAGDVARTRALSARLLDSPSRPRDRARVLATLGVLEQYAGSVPRAGELLSAAAELAEGPDRVWALAELGITRFRLNDLAGLYACAEEIVAVADRDDLRQRVPADFLHGVALVLGGDAAGAVGPLTSVIELAPSVKLRDDPRHLLYLGLAAGFLGDVRPAIAAGEPLLAAARERGALGFLVPALALTAAARAWTGDHRGAFADAGEAADLGEQLGYAADVAVAVEMLAWQSAARGLHDDARQAMAQARALTDRAGTTGVASHQAITAAFCALCRLDLSEAATVLEARIAVDGGVGEMGQPLGVAPTLVEAYVGLGRAVEAADLAARYAAASAAAVDPPTTALVARCLALTASDDELAVDRFETALAAHAQAPDVFEAARTRLLYGSWLRRAGRRTLARNQLGAAQAAFAAMDLTAWELRTADELAATGATARPRTTLASEPLTAQETRVSQLVARGLSNREVAAAMFVSPKTVEHHLGSVFRKRGFRSRAALASALATTPEND